MRTKMFQVFRKRREIERYFGGKTIACLLCGQRFRRLGSHLAAKHDLGVNDYRTRFGLPWTRGLTSTASRASSGWTKERKAKARKLAEQSRFFERAHLTARREPAPFLRAEAIRNLGIHPRTLSETFERQVRFWFEKGLSDRAIARILKVSSSTVNRRTRHWRNPSRSGIGRDRPNSSLHG